MPIYEYQCPKCGRVFEEWVKASEAHREEPCPACGTPSPRILSRTSFVLKGEGWYVSDYGYRKGITEDGGSGASVPAESTPTTPATQGEKALAAKEPAAPAPTTAKPASSSATAAASAAKPAAAGATSASTGSTA